MSTPQRARHALVVDDSLAIRKTIRRMIEPMGFTVDEASNGKEALDHYATRHPDVVFLDVEMPGMDGLSVLRHLRGPARVMWAGPNDPGDGMPRIIMCTARSSFETIREAINAGADEYIIKPFDSQVLNDKLHLCGLM